MSECGIPRWKYRLMSMSQTSLDATQATPAEAIFGPFDGPIGSHERVIYAHDRASGLKAIVAIHSTLLGPALGGTRFYPYANETAALSDVLRLSRGMTFKAAAAGLDVGGGKGVILGDPDTIKTPKLLEAYGRLVESLGGTFITGGDVGTTSEDVDVIGRTTAHVLTRTRGAGGSGDSGPLTAFGVFQAMRAAALHTWGEPTLAGRRVAVEGLGKVGYHLASHLLEDGAEVVAADTSAAAVERIQLTMPMVTLVERVLDADVDVYAPCALGGTITGSSAAAIRARIICGAANNQLASPDVEDVLAAHGITWVPDYIASAGGLIQGVVEREGGDAEEAVRRVQRIFETAETILGLAVSQKITPGAAGHSVALARLRAAVATSGRGDGD
jgi:valine dehydrogenase (NAD+)